MLDDLKVADVSVVTVSADLKEKAEADVASEGWRFPAGYGLSMEQMRAPGLYISEPRSQKETDRPFAGPGRFVINSEGTLQIFDFSNAPFARPGLSTVLTGIKLTKEKRTRFAEHAPDGRHAARPREASVGFLSGCRKGIRDYDPRL